jgi:hypothetical protein
MHDWTPVFVLTIIFGSIAFVLFKIFDDRHRERMGIIEKGLVKEDVKFLYSSSHSWRLNPLSALKWGMLAAFIGLGILISTFVAPAFPWIEHEQLMTGFVFLFGGLGLILFYAMAAKKTENEAA